MFLAIPAIMFERAGPMRAIRRPGELVRKNWGGQLVSVAVLGFAL